MVKPTKKKRKFIGKHEEKVSFYLVHRSQKDPLAADETAPQHVLQQVEDKKVDVEKRKEEQKKFGVFFDDDYNYLQHLRDVSGINDVELVENTVQDFKLKEKNEKEVRLKLPSSVFASQVEETTGLLNKAAPRSGPQLDWDPDLVAALDEDFDFENPDNQLEDDFVMRANASGDEEGNAHDSCSSDDKGNYSADEDADSVCNTNIIRRNSEAFDEDYFENEETCSRFTDYSMSSAVIPRNNGLKSLDDRFEKLYEQYDECEIGSLDGDDVIGHLTLGDSAFKQVFEDYQKHLTKMKCEKTLAEDERNHLLPDLIENDQEDYTTVVLEEPVEKWDCESILSTYSNIYNHPKLISEPSKVRPIKISKTTGIPVESLKKRKLTKKDLKELDKDFESRNTPSVTIAASKRNETPEEKKLRKMAVKEQRRERRLEKKANTLAFKEEKKRQEKILLNVQQNLQGIKLV